MAPTTLDKQLRQAIATKRLIEIKYAGQVRIVEPHDYGTLNSIDRLLAYQRRKPGAANNVDASGWRLFDVSKIEACTVLEQTFHGSRAEAHRRHYAWEVVHARVP